MVWCIRSHSCKGDDMSRYIQTAAAFGVWWLIAWVGGYNFDERSPGAAYWLIVSLLSALFIWTMPRGKQ